ncbi:MAG: Uma2 family endonuclease [Aphanocapsa sp. GSE-SYN-MK-11-07L]|jgi:Uma2 family endonuclease|nr:Uma2 family endonuclease [Aphanocapsa sp. GSE-SYN-MK-11-07L]
MVTIPLTDLDQLFPDSDGKPMSDNTEQFRWIVLLKENLEILFADQPLVFVAGDLLWYPELSTLVPGVAPDAMVVFGRPKGRRGSYRQWQEENIPPQVVFEIISPSNTAAEMTRKLEFYQRYGVEEYYLYDPDRNRLQGWLCQESELTKIADLQGWISPRLGIRFQPQEPELAVYFPDGRRFLTTVELSNQADQAEQRAAEAEQRAQQEQQRAEQEKQRADRLADYLRSQGINPNDLP